MPAAQLNPVTYTGKLAKVDPHAVIKRYLTDEKIEDIAKSLGCSRQLLGFWLIANNEDEWKKAQVARAVARLETAEQEQEDVRLPKPPKAPKEPVAVPEGSDDYPAYQLAYTTWTRELAEWKNETKTYEVSLERAKVALAHARERVKSAQWQLERLLSRLYGTKPDIQVNIGSSLISMLANLDSRTIEGEKVE